MYSEITKFVDIDSIKFNEPMKNHTSFRVGGLADVLVKPKSEEEIINLIKYLKENSIPYFVMGNGSNLLVKDGGIRGVVIKISKEFSCFKIDGNKIFVSAGCMLSVIGKALLKEGLTGFEFASGIPGTIGGALTMNAGAYGGEMKDIVKEVKVIDENGDIKILTNEEMEFSYRKSILNRKNYVILSATLELNKGNIDEIKDTMNEITKKRVTNQPLNMPSAGSTFKRPEGYFAAKLIEDAGLKGLTLRGAQVSDKHSGFIINNGDATAKDLLNLMYIVKNIVKSKFNIQLEEEVKIIGED